MTTDREPLYMGTMAGLGLRVNMALTLGLRAGLTKAEGDLRAKLTRLAGLPSDRHQLTILWDEDDPNVPPTLVLLDPPVADPNRPGWWHQDALTLDPTSDPDLEAVQWVLHQLHREGLTIDQLGATWLPNIGTTETDPGPDAVVLPFPAAVAPPDPSTMED